MPTQIALRKGTGEVERGASGKREGGVWQHHLLPGRRDPLVKGTEGRSFLLIIVPSIEQEWGVR